MIVTLTVAGSAATSVVPVGRLAVTGTSWTPALSPATSSVADEGRPGQTVEVRGRSADGHEHAIDRQRVGEVAAVADEVEAGAEGARRRSPAGSAMVTVTGSSLTATTPVGSASPTWTISSADTPVIGIGSVSTWVSSASWSASPVDEGDERIDGDRFDLEPGGRVAGDDRVDRQGPALAVREDRDDHARRRWRDVERADRVAELVDRDELGVLVDVDAGRLDGDVGPNANRPARRATPPPVTVTVSGSTVVVPRVRPSGTGPWTTSTGTSRDLSSSSSTVAKAGS